MSFLARHATANAARFRAHCPLLKDTRGLSYSVRKPQIKAFQGACLEHSRLRGRVGANLLSSPRSIAGTSSNTGPHNQRPGCHLSDILVCALAALKLTLGGFAAAVFRRKKVAQASSL
jgi:hypothetical protein